MATGVSRRQADEQMSSPSCYNDGMDIANGLTIPDDEFQFTFARSGGPGGQNVNKVASKATLRWNLTANTSLPAEVKERLRAQQRRRITTEDDLIIQGQRFRDQAKNVADCLDRLRALVEAALHTPRPRKATRPSRGSKERRLATKREQAQRKARRRKPAAED
jgi:ribosome-associated protein